MAQIFCITVFSIIELHHAATVKDIFTSNLNSDSSQTDLLALIRVPRDAQLKDLQAAESEILPDREGGTETDTVVRKARNSKFYSEKFRDGERTDRSLKPEDNSDDGRGTTKSSTALGKRCTTCDSGYLRSSYDRDRGRDRYDRDPYYSYNSRSRYDPYDRYDRYDYDDYDRDGYRDYNRGRNKYTSSYADRYEPRDRYYDRGLGYDNRGYGYRERDYYYSPYMRDRYEAYSPYDDYYSRGSGYDSYSRGSYQRPEYAARGYGNSGYARGYGYGDRDRPKSYWGGPRRC